MIIYILVIAHFLADFTFQSTRLAYCKLNSNRDFLCHASIYAFILLIAIFPFVKFSRAIIPYIIIIISHSFIDWIRINVDKKFKGKQTITFISFIMDQILHVLILIVLYHAFNLGVETTELYCLIQQWPYFNNLVIYCLVFIILWDPTAVFIKKIFIYISNENNYVQENNDLQVGRIIGKLERIIISILILNNQYSAVGFVLTAKSIARYKQLEEKNFAEKYLVGTLTSVLIAIIVTIFLKQFLK